MALERCAPLRFYQCEHNGVLRALLLLESCMCAGEGELNVSLCTNQVTIPLNIILSFLPFSVIVRSAL